MGNGKHGKKLHLCLLVSFVAVFIWSAIGPKDYFTWALEVFPAFYELIEWWVAELTGTAAEAFLGTQGDVWDTQWDMFLALCGSIVSLLSLSKIHDKYLNILR
ncbi:MAG: hypothetical protein CVU89_03305 [Firmicutes bacterium HGW-Firmicutes-14]|nr:MAG: hypothetical protein CVU89_03305 [Firmicutes bacterium HGW-Firmicutes-14]